MIVSDITSRAIEKRTKGDRECNQKKAALFYPPSIQVNKQAHTHTHTHTHIPLPRREREMAINGDDGGAGFSSCHYSYTHTIIHCPDALNSSDQAN